MYEVLSYVTWHLNDAGYALSNKSVNNSGVRCRMHRVILGLQRGDLRLCDHIDGNRLNNQRSNLRIATHAQNHANRGITSMKTAKSKSIYKGVYFHAERRKWQARITQAGKIMYLGSFDNEIDAALAYNTSAIKLFGAFARLNVIAERL